jgi:hypothetical protein
MNYKAVGLGTIGIRQGIMTGGRGRQASGREHKILPFGAAFGVAAALVGALRAGGFASVQEGLMEEFAVFLLQLPENKMQGGGWGRSGNDSTQQAEEYRRDSADGRRYIEEEEELRASIRTIGLLFICLLASLIFIIYSKLKRL